MRKLCLFLVIVVGAFWLVGAFALDYPAKTQAVDDLTGALRPAFTDDGLARANADVATATTFASDFQTKAVPALAQQTMAAEQTSFEQADAVPTRDMPNTTVHWLFVALGLSAIGIGVAGLATRGRALPPAAAGLGVVVIAATLLLWVPAKTSAVDELTAAFRPVFTEQGATHARGSARRWRPTSRLSPPASNSSPPSSAASMHW